MLQERDEEEEVREDATFAYDFEVRRIFGVFLCFFFCTFYKTTILTIDRCLFIINVRGNNLFSLP